MDRGEIGESFMYQVSREGRGEREEELFTVHTV